MSDLLEDERVVLDALDFDMKSCEKCSQEAAFTVTCTNSNCSNVHRFCVQHKNLLLMFIALVCAGFTECVHCGLEGRASETIRIEAI